MESGAEAELFSLSVTGHHCFVTCPLCFCPCHVLAAVAKPKRIFAPVSVLRGKVRGEVVYLG